MSSDEEDYGDLDDIDDETLLAASNVHERQSQLPSIQHSSSNGGQTGPEEYFDGIFTSDLDVDLENELGVPDVTGPLRQRNLFGAIVDDNGTDQTTTRGWRLVNHQEPPTHHKIDREAAKTWTYPTNVGHREYQFNIVKRSLFQNVLCALPTGLGKTFIAATVMLNWFRWAPESQIVFMAPTKPLVSQQIDACYTIAGIPRSQTCQLTGNVSPGIRAEYWQEKRVFFMTPQTLETDLTSGRCDPKRISLLVVDEAHRATGQYAYTKVVAFIRRFNNSFRVLALTATPGSKIETVQDVITSLGIARTEIRTEESLDIRDYIQKRNIEVEKFPISDEIAEIRDLFAKLLKPPLKKLNEMKAFYQTDPTMLTTFALIEGKNKYLASVAGRTANMGLRQMVIMNFTILSQLSYAFELLLYHGIRPFYDYIHHFYSENAGKPKGGGKIMTAVIQDKNFETVLRRCKGLVNEPDFVGHPKLDFLCSTILKHFSDATERGETDTKVMVFSNYRNSGEEILRVLKTHKPIIKPQIFIGQSAGKSGDGMTQKEQQEVVQKFKDGHFNVLVATSIGEEGLDIGEVDFIVCYDASASPIRMLQRMGRTGRKRTGGVLVLVTEGKEANKWEKANDNYRWIQNKIALGKDFQYAEDLSPRIIPTDIEPVCNKQHIDPPPENLEPAPAKEKQSRVRKKAPPRKFHMPDGVETGFTTAAKLGGFTSARTSTSKQMLAAANDDDEDDFMLEDVHEEILQEPEDAEAGFLTLEQEDELKKLYRTVYSGDDDQIIGYPQLNAFPQQQRKLTRTVFLKHGRATKSFVNMVQNMHRMDEFRIEQYRLNLQPEDKINVPFTPSRHIPSSPFTTVANNRPVTTLDLNQPAASSLSKLAAFRAPLMSKKTGLTENLAKINHSVNSRATNPVTSAMTTNGFTSARSMLEDAASKLVPLQSSPDLTSSLPSSPIYQRGKGSNRAESEESDDLPTASQLLGKKKPAPITAVAAIKRKSMTVENDKPKKAKMQQRKPQRVIMDSEEDEDED